MFGTRKVKRYAHHELVLMLLAIRNAHERNPAHPDLVDSSLVRTFSIPDQWDRVEVHLTNGQVVIGLVMNRVLSIIVDGEDIAPHPHHLTVKPYDVLEAIKAEKPA